MTVKTEKTYFKALYAVILVLCLLILVTSLNRFFAHDELEHIHAAWYVQQGAVPYLDFYQNHHPLLWYLLSPLLALFGHNVSTLPVLRLLMLLFTFGTVLVTYRLARRVTGSRETVLLALVFLLSMVMFVEKGIEIRPDVPQVFFGLLAVYYFLGFTGGMPGADPNHPAVGSPMKHACLSGFFLAVSFLFLQKSVFLVLVLGGCALYFWIKKKVVFKTIFLFAFSFAWPVVFFVLFLWLSGSLGDYFLCNWWVHMFHGESFSFLSFFAPSLGQNLPFWVLSLWGAGFVVSRKGRDLGRGLRMTAFLALLMFLSVLLVKHPYRQYYLFALCLLSVTAACFTRLLFFRYQATSRKKVVALGLIVLVPLVFLVSQALHSHGSQLRRIDYVLTHTGPADPVYDGDIQFNLFRPDLHYFWYAVKNGGLDTYNRLTGGRFAGYDPLVLINKYNPKIIYSFSLDLKDPGLLSRYRQTPFKNLYIRRDFP